MRTILLALLILLTALLLVEAAFSLAWPIAHDQAPLLYQAFLMRTQGRLPYRDLFDFQMPGAYAAFYILGLLSRFDPLRIRLLDLTLLAALLGLTYSFMRGFGRKPALTAVTLFGLKYLQGGPSLALQREYLLLVFVALALFLFVHRPPFIVQDGYPLPRCLLIGLCFGLAAVIKPQAAIGLLPFLLFDLTDWIKSRRGLPPPSSTVHGPPSIVPLLAGFSIPIATTLIWLAVTGALTPFLDIALNYWPLYAQINGELVVLTGPARWLYLLDQLWRLGGHGLWLLPAGLGTYLSLRRASLPDPTRRLLLLLLWLSLSYALYPALTGQFFPYHYLPFVYFIVLLSSFCLIDLKETKSMNHANVVTTSVVRPKKHKTPLCSFVPFVVKNFSINYRKLQAAALALLTLVLLLTLRPPAAILRQIEGRPLPPAGGRAEKIAAYLQTHLQPGQTVQPLDWTGGALQAMLTARAPLATTFVFDFYFYHHLSSPYIQGLRTRFIRELQAASPAYIVEITSMDKPWVNGPDTSRDFPELRAFLAANYLIDLQKDDFIIYTRR